NGVASSPTRRSASGRSTPSKRRSTTRSSATAAWSSSSRRRRARCGSRDPRSSSRIRRRPSARRRPRSAPTPTPSSRRSATTRPPSPRCARRASCSDRRADENLTVPAAHGPGPTRHARSAAAAPQRGAAGGTALAIPGGASPMAVSPPQEAPGGRPVAPDRERRVAEALLAIESLDLNVVLDRICRLTVALMPCDRATAYLYSHRARGFVAVADCGTPPHVFRRFVDKLYFGRSRAGERGRMVPFRTELVAGRIGVATRDDPVEPENCELLEALEQYAMCLVPFRSSTRGALFVTLDRPPVFDDTALRIVQTIARQASNLVDHARTFRTVRHAARVRAGIAALAAAVNRESDPARIAALVSAEAAALFRLAVVAVL